MGKPRYAGYRRWRCAAVLMVVVAVGLIAAFPAAAADEHQLGPSFGPDGTSASDFARAAQIAVDQQSEAVYVLDQGAGAIYKFGPDGESLDFGGSAPYIDGNEITGLTVPAGFGESQVAVDSQSHTIYVTSGNAVRAFQQNGEAADFTAGPGSGTSEIGGFEELLGVAVDSAGNIYASDYRADTIRVFAASGEPVTEISTPDPANLAVAPSGAIYVVQWQGPVFKLTPSEFPPTGTTTYATAAEPIDQAVSQSVAVDPASEDVYVVDMTLADGYKVSQYDSSGSLITTFAGKEEEGELPSSQGIAVNGTTEDVYVSYFSPTASKVEIFTPPVIVVGPPSVSGLSAAGVSADAATLRALLNPNTFETEYYFEYGTEDCESIPNPCSPILPSQVLPPGHEAVAVSAHLSGLLAGTTYHYRVVAENEADPTFSEDRTFTTQNAGGTLQLPDGRRWEMVSPAIKQGGGIITRGDFGLTPASADGSAFSYLSVAAIKDNPAGNRAPELSQSLARHTASGWESAEISPPHEFASPLNSGTEFRQLSTDLARAAVEPQGSGALSVEASERTPYLREGFGEPARWRPLVTGKEGFANVEAGTVFGGEPATDSRSPVRFRGASPDLRHVVVSSEVPLSPDAAGVSAPRFSLPGLLYMWFEGNLELVSVLPSGDATTGVVGSTGDLGQGSVDHAVSADGRYVYWSSGTRSALYVRDLQEDETIRVDVQQSDASGAGDEEPIFQGASTDGRRAFFTDTQQLTADASSAGLDLYECELVEAAGETQCELRNLTGTGGGEPAGFQGVVSAIGDDGETVFFVANGALAAGAAPGNCKDSPATSPVGATCNLYAARFEEGGWETSFVATLPNRDAANWGLVSNNGQGLASRQPVVAAASPSGRFFSFMTSRSVTGYDNRDVSSGLPAVEVFLYDAEAESLRCVSCNPTNARPRAALLDADAATSLVDWNKIWSNRWVAATLPESNSPEATAPSSYRPRAVLDNGRVLFNSLDALVPADATSAADVYQYEPTGVGSCVAKPTGAGVAAIEGGCVSLLSSGTSSRESAVLDASASGDDVFFLTAARLGGGDADSAYDVYDAHVCGSGWACAPGPPLPPASCDSPGSCRPSAGVQPEAALIPGSASFNGSGNVKPKHHKKKHGKKKHGKKKHHKASKRGAHRQGAPGRIGGVK